MAIPYYNRDEFQNDWQRKQIEQAPLPSRSRIQEQYDYMNGQQKATGVPPSQSMLDVNRQKVMATPPYYGSPGLSGGNLFLPSSINEPLSMAPQIPSANPVWPKFSPSSMAAVRPVPQASPSSSVPAYSANAPAASGGSPSVTTSRPTPPPYQMTPLDQLKAANAGPMSDAERQQMNNESAFRQRQQQAINTGAEGAFRRDAEARRAAALQARMDPRVRGRLDSNAAQGRQDQARAFDQGVVTRQLDETGKQNEFGRNFATRQQDFTEKSTGIDQGFKDRQLTEAERQGQYGRTEGTQMNAAQRRKLESEAGYNDARSRITDRTPYTGYGQDNGTKTKPQPARSDLMRRFSLLPGAGGVPKTKEEIAAYGKMLDELGLVEDSQQQPAGDATSQDAQPVGTDRRNGKKVFRKSDGSYVYEDGSKAQ